MEQAEDVLEISRNKGYTPGTVAYLSLLCAYAKLGDLDGMLKVLLLIYKTFSCAAKPHTSTVVVDNRLCFSVCMLTKSVL